MSKQVLELMIGVMVGWDARIKHASSTMFWVRCAVYDIRGCLRVCGKRNRIVYPVCWVSSVVGLHRSPTSLQMHLHPPGCLLSVGLSEYPVGTDMTPRVRGQTFYSTVHGTRFEVFAVRGSRELARALYFIISWYLSCQRPAPRATCGCRSAPSASRISSCIWRMLYK